MQNILHNNKLNMNASANARQMYLSIKQQLECWFGMYLDLSAKISYIT